MDLARVIIGHCGDTEDLDYLQQLLDGGSYLGMDRFGLSEDEPRRLMPTAEQLVAIVASSCRKGYADRMVMSHDAHLLLRGCARPKLELPHDRRGHAVVRRVPNLKFGYVPTSVAPALLEVGVSEAEIRKMTHENPLVTFERGAPY